MLDYVEDDRPRAKFMYIESFSASPNAQRIREEAIEAMIELIDQGRQEMDDPDTLTRATAEGIAGGVFQQIRGALERDLPDAFELTPQLMHNVVVPYLGTRAAMAELALEPPRAARERGR